MSATRLHLAAFDGDNDAVNQLLTKKTDVNVRTDYNETPLLFAAMGGHIAAVRTLLKWGADPNILPLESSSPLRRAIAGGHAEVVRVLLAKGANPNAIAPQKIRTPEETAKEQEQMRNLLMQMNDARDGSTEMNPPTDDEVNQMIADKTNERNLASSGKLRALSSAIQSGSIETLKVLLEAGYSPIPSADDKTSLCLLNFARSVPNKLEMARLLLQHGMSPDGQGGVSPTPLETAVTFSDVAFARLLVDAGARIDLKRTGMGLLSLAVMRENREMIEFLIDKNIGLDDPMLDTFARGKDLPYLQELLDQKRKTHWFSFVNSGDIHKVEESLRSGVDIDFANGREGPALQIAVNNGDTAMVRFLLEAGANVNRRDRYDRTPLYTAAAKGMTEVLSLLFRHGAAIEMENRSGSTPLYLAAQSQHQDAADILIAHGAGLSVVEAILLQRMDVANDFWSRGTPVDYTNEVGMTALHAAVYIGDAELISRLLDRGADIHGRDKAKRTPLGISISRENAEITRLLLDRGADAVKDGNGNHSPLSTATLYRDEGVVRLLLERGAPQEQPISEEIVSRLTNTKGLKSGLNNMLEKMKNNENLFNQLTQSQRLIHPDSPSAPWQQPHRLWAVIRTLLEFGADANAIDNEKNSLLSSLVELEAPLELIQYALEKGAKVNPEEDKSRVPLMIAIDKNRLDVITVLLDAGANPNGGYTRESPLQMARDKGLSEVVTLLEKYGASEEKRQAFVDSLGEMALWMLQPAIGSTSPSLANMPIFDFSAFRNHLSDKRGEEIQERRKWLEKEVRIAEGLN